MAGSNSSLVQVEGLADRLWNQALTMISVGFGVFFLAALSVPDWVRSLLMLIGGCLIVLLLVSGAVTAHLRRRNARDLGLVAGTIADRDTAQWITTLDGDVLFANTAAEAAFGKHVPQENIAVVLERRVLGIGDALRRAEASAEGGGQAELKISSLLNEKGVTSHVVGGRFRLWSLDDMPPASEQEVLEDAAQIATICVQENDHILFMNAAARQLLGGQRDHLSAILREEIKETGEIQTVWTAQGERQCLVVQVSQIGNRRTLCLVPTEIPAVRKGAIQFDELPVALLKVGRDGRVEMANRSARRMINREIGTYTLLSDLMEGLGRSIRDWLNEAALGHGSAHSEFLRLKRTDREVFVQVSLNRVVEGDTCSLIAVLSDATELKTLEAQFVQSQKMQAIGQLAGGVAHDFNNLLTAISGHCDLLLLRHDQSDPDFGDLVQINQNANRAAALVGQLLAFSRKQNLRPEILDLRNTLSDLTHLLNRLVGERVSLVLRNDPDLPSIRADKRQLEQVLMNLVVNARDAMPGGGEIRIETECLVLRAPMERDRVTVPAGRYVSVKVADDGVGIASDKLQKVFEPFFTTKRTGEGTGLGLSTAYGIVKQTGGYIFVDSTIGVGTVFSLLFPVHDQDSAQPVPVSAEIKKEALPVHSGGVVLLVEDEAPVRSFASRALRLRGLTVLEAGSGEEALELLAKDTPEVDLFVTDVIMPGVNGPGWVREARKAYPETPVIFVSGYAEDSFTDDQAEIENSSFLPKPFSLADLTEAVQGQLVARQSTLS